MTTHELPPVNPEPHHTNFVRMQQPAKALNVYVYLNGNKHFNRRKVVVNDKRLGGNFNGFLHEVTLGVKAPFGAVRKIYTPQNGHRVGDLHELQQGMHVVAAGNEKFRRLHYNEIGIKKLSPRKPTERRPPPRMIVSSKWRKSNQEPRTIYVYANGLVDEPAKRILITPRCMKSWDHVLTEITEKIPLPTATAVQKLYDLEYYRLLTDPSELVNNQYYVAVGSERRVKKLSYGRVKGPKKNQAPLPPIKRGMKPRPGPHNEEDQTYTKMYNQKKQYKDQEETTVMGASAATGYRPLRVKKQKSHKTPVSESPVHEGESVFHAKPVKVKRSGGNRAVVGADSHPPADEDEGVFKANSEQVKAEEVEENEDTKVDLPIDQVPADEVMEERIDENEARELGRGRYSDHEEDEDQANERPIIPLEASTRNEETDIAKSPEHRDSDENEDVMIAPVPSSSGDLLRDNYDAKSDENPDDQAFEDTKSQESETLHENLGEANSVAVIASGSVEEETVEEPLNDTSAHASVVHSEERIEDHNEDRNEERDEEYSKEVSANQDETELTNPAPVDDEDVLNETTSNVEEDNAIPPTIVQDETASAVVEEENTPNEPVISPVPSEDQSMKEDVAASKVSSEENIPEINSDKDKTSEEALNENNAEDIPEDARSGEDVRSGEENESKPLTPSSPTPFEESDQNLHSADLLSSGRDADATSRSEADGADVTREENQPDDETIGKGDEKDEDAVADETAAKFVTTRPASEEPAADDPVDPATSSSKHSIPNGTTEPSVDRTES